ncbi:Diguanylate cyclase [Paramixta manurensis]|uniref:diguanylate cyclase n=1 Tax=Paramixta manurensis TaxID=2740817 RepID=A0A6M8U631_9GAMM|nr:Diguanylate cyclase [Erwiniaceae bacterium PD-1]
MVLAVPTLLRVDPRRSGLRFARRAYFPRIVGLGFGAISVAFCLSSISSFWLYVALFLNGFIWPHLAYLRSLRAADPMRRERDNLLIDALLGGVWIALMGLNALPSVMIVAMMGMNNVSAGGVKLLLRAYMGQLVSMGITLLIVQPSINFATSPSQVYVCLPMLLIYPIFLGHVIYRMAIRLAQHKRQLMEISTLDGMTGVYNRRHWEHLLRNEYDNCMRYQRMATLLLIDIDHFKIINDTWGHDTGDEALLIITEELRLTLRASDVIGRFGGDEFAVIMPETPSQSAMLAIGRVRNHLTDRGQLTHAGMTLHISVGIAQFHPEMQTYREWLKAADLALYRAKNSGRGRTEIAGI